MGEKWKKFLPPAFTLLIFFFIFQRIPFGKFLAALRDADFPTFMLLMVPNSLFFFAWDTWVLTLVMRWFHGPIRYRNLLPVRAVTYVVSLLNTNLARGATALYLTQQLRAPFFQIASTVVFLTLLETTHLAAWATVGMLAYSSRIPKGLFWIPAGFVLFWCVFLLYARLDFAPWRAVLAPFSRLFPSLRGRVRIREWSIFRTFDQAPLKRYVQVVLLRAPAFVVSLIIHFLAVRTFGVHIPLAPMLAYLPIIFMLGALPVTVAHLGTTQAAWLFFFGNYATGPQLLAYSLASHLAFMMTRAMLGVVFLPRAYKDLFGPVSPQGWFAPRPAPPIHSSDS